MTTGAAPAVVPRVRRSSVTRFLVAGALSGLLTAAAVAAVIRFSGPPLCQTQDNGFGCLGATGGLSLVALAGLVLLWAALWWWAGSRWPWAVVFRGLPLVLGGLVVVLVASRADGLRAASFAFSPAENDLHSATLALLWLACLGSAALAGAALWVARRRRRAVLLVPALVVSLVGADALAAVGVLGYQTWRVRAAAPHPYGLVDPGLTLVSTRVVRGALTLGYRTADARGVDVTVTALPAGLDLTAPCGPAVTAPTGDRVRACEQTTTALPDAVVWATSAFAAAGPPAAVVVAQPDALVMLSANDLGVGPADLLPLLDRLRPTGAVTLLRSTEEAVDVR